VIVGILLAAGGARRFGSDKRLHPLADGTPMALGAARTLKAALPASYAVVADDDAELAGRLQAAGIGIVRCAHSARGMGASLACGVRALPDADGWVIALADMPFIEVASIRAVAGRLAAGAALAAPVHAGRRGHPVGFAREYGDALRALDGDRGARDLIERDRARLALIPVADAGVLRDVDTPVAVTHRTYPL